MTEPGALPTYATVAAAGGVSIWATSVQTWLGITVAALTIAVLIVRLWVDIPRALRKRKEPDR